MIGTWKRWRHRRPLKPINDFEVLRKWEASKFASQSGPLTRVPRVAPLEQQQRAFGWMDAIDERDDLPVSDITFRGELVPVDKHVELTAAARLVAQFEADEGYLLLVAFDVFSWIIQFKMPFTLTPGQEHFWTQFPYFTGTDHVIAYWVSHDFEVWQNLSLSNTWSMMKSKRYMPPYGDQSLVLQPSIDRVTPLKNAIRLHMFRGPVVDIAVGREGGHELLPGEVITLERLVPWWPVYRDERHPWSKTKIKLRGADHPVLVRVSVWRSWARHLTRWFRPRPKPEHFPMLHKEHGWTDYQGGALEDEFKRYPMRRYYKWLK